MNYRRYDTELSKEVALCRQESTEKLLKTMFVQSELHMWLVLMMAVFYAIPVMQLVFKHQKEMTFTGNNDVCYYNFLCTIPCPLGNIQNFNHILSNIGYVAFGLTFVLVVWYRYFIKIQLFLQIFTEMTKELAKLFFIVVYPRNLISGFV